MKLMKYSWLAALPMIFTACQDDMLVEKHSQQGIYHLTASMEKKEAETRAQIVLNGTSKEKESFHWNEGDQFVLYQLADETNKLSAHDFSISETYTNEKPAASADFSTLDALTKGREYLAFYPPRTVNEQGEVHLKINYALEDNSKDAWTEYFQNNMYMIAGGATDETNVHFDQFCGLIRIVYTNTSKEDRTFDRIHVNGSWITGGYFQLDNLDEFHGNVTATGALGLTFKNKATVKAGATENFYILFMENGTEDNPTPMSNVVVDLDVANKKSMMTPAKKLPFFNRGRCYWLNITDNGKELIWTNDAIDDGGDEEPEVEILEVEVNDITGLKDAMENEMVTHIALKNPIIVDGEEEVCFVPSYPKNISMSDDFTWTVNGQVYDALIVNSCPGLEIRNCTVSGSDTESSTDKYLLASTDGTLFLDNMDLQANGNMNAVSLDNNKNFYLYGSTSSITVQNDGKYAFKVNSSTTSSTVYLDEGTIEGNVDYIDNYSTEESRGWFVLDRVKINGNLTVEGGNVQYLNIEIREGATYTGTGWDSWKTTNN